MNTLKRIIKLSKNVALELLNKKKVDTSEIDHLFSHDDTEDIIESLTDVKIKKERERVIKELNKTKQQDWEKIKPNNVVNRNKKRILFFYRIAAILIVGTSIVSYLYFENNNVIKNTVESKVVNSPLDENSIILELDNGNKEVIAPDGSKSILDKNGKVVGVQSGTSLDYSKKDKTVKKLVYNQLTIPYGKVFKIVLSDGTEVHLNAGSSLRYPVHFIEGKNRTVFLKGEAFFDVEKNPKKPFVVNTDNMQVEVLGTKFNVSSYMEDSSINTVLVEGSVAISSNDIYSKSKATLLKPGNKANWKKESGDIKINKVDTELYTSWIEGRIVFKHMPFENILKKLERHYNVSITNNNKSLIEENLTASFDVETIDQVLNSFSKNLKFNYTIKNNHITIN